MEKSIIDLGDRCTVKYAAGDDAKKVFTVRLEGLAAGKGPVGLAFRHAIFLMNACDILESKTGEPEYYVMAQQFAIIDELSAYRNRRLVRLFNGVDMRVLLAKITLMATGTAEPNDPTIDQCIDFADDIVVRHKLMARANACGVDYRPYFSTANDDADVAGFRNPWCLDVQSSPVVTGDLVSITIDASNVAHVLLIERGFSPGIGQFALPGGFKEAKDLLDEQTSLREFSEETGFETTGMVTTYYPLASLHATDHDPRPRFSEHGTISHAIMRLDMII